MQYNHHLGNEKEEVCGDLEVKILPSLGSGMCERGGAWWEGFTCIQCVH